MALPVHVEAGDYQFSFMQPMVISFQLVRTRVRIEGFNCHHLIPRQVVESRGFARFFGNLRGEGFNPDDFLSNGMHLPSNEKLALAFGLPMHRGPHPQYNELVASHIAALQPLKPKEALNGVALLQKRLRLSLRSFGACEITLCRTPMASRLSSEFDSIGELIALRNAGPRLP